MWESVFGCMCRNTPLHSDMMCNTGNNTLLTGGACNGWNQVLCWIQALRWCVRVDYLSIWWILHKLTCQFPSKITTFSCFLKQLIHSQHTLQVTICPVSDPALFKANTPLWAAVGTSSMKAQQAPECVGAHQWTSGHSKEPAVCWWSNHPLSSWLLGEWSAPQCYTDNLSDAEILVSYIFACELWFYSYGGFLCLEACNLFLTHNLGKIL